jgi:hypothetical protein
MKESKAITLFVVSGFLSVGSALAQKHAVQTVVPTAERAGTGAVLVELFTSEGCSSCPPADEVLRQIGGRTTSEGQLIVGLSEHVSY